MCFFLEKIYTFYNTEVIREMLALYDGFYDSLLYWVNSHKLEKLQSNKDLQNICRIHVTMYILTILSIKFVTIFLFVFVFYRHWNQLTGACIVSWDFRILNFKILFKFFFLYSDNVFCVVDAFSVPRYTYSADRKKFIQ